MGVGTEIEIGGVKEEELDTMLRLMCEAFSLPYGGARAVFYADPYFDPANKWVLRVNGKVVSCLTLVETSCWLGSAVVKMTGIAGVATAMTERKKGHAALLLKEILAELRRRGVALTALFPYDYAYYRKFGWEMAGIGVRSHIETASLPAYPDYLHVRMAAGEDIAALARLYDETSAGRALHCLRDEKRWRYLMTYVPFCLVYAPYGGRVEGYLLFDYQAESQNEIEKPEADERPQARKVLRILEMVAAIPEAQRGLIGYLARQPQADRVVYTSHEEAIAESGLLRPALNPVTMTPARIEVVPTLMARIVDLKTLAESLRDEWKGFRGMLCLKMTDTILPAGQVQVLVRSEAEGDMQIVEVHSINDLPLNCPVIDGDVRGWSQVAVGYRSAMEACGLGLLKPSHPQAAQSADRLFPARSPFLPLPDHF